MKALVQSKLNAMASISKQVCHVFLWKWNGDEYSGNEKKSQVLRELEELFDDQLLVKLTCGENCINDLNLLGAGDNPKSSFSSDFDCGLIAIAKDDSSFRDWWASEQHLAFMEKHPRFATTKINLEWRS